MQPEPLVSVIVPVKDGAHYLAELLEAVRCQRLDGVIETLVVDSGSRDGSVEIARSAATRVIEIPAASFKHGRTRNFAAEQARGAYLAFLTQDATPADELWLARLLAALDSKARVGLAFGPHGPRQDTSPMIARELEQFFGSFSPDRSVRVDCTIDAADPASGFFSNVNCCIARACWEEVRFPDVAYAEDQAFARAAIASGWCKAFVPDASVLHAHDYPFGQFMRRYFDEFRGLRESVGHVEPAGIARVAGNARRQVAGDLSYMRSRGWDRGQRIRWGLRSARHHVGRSLFSTLGSHSERLPATMTRRISLERRAGAAAGSEPARGSLQSAAKGTPHDYVSAYWSSDAAPLAVPSPHDGDKPILHLAWIVPPFRRGSGGHMTLFTIARELEDRGHSCSIWIHDPSGGMDRRAALAQREIEEHFVSLRAGVFKGFDDWQGADVALATGWQTAYPLWNLADCKLKAYFVQDYEPDFFPASAQRVWAEATYSMGYPCVAASPWLRDLVRERYGARAEAFELGVDLDVYKPLGLERDPRTVVFYSRSATPRRATELGILALAEVVRRHPDLKVVMFGDVDPPRAPFEYTFGGVMDEAALARLYNEATVGLVISLTNYSRMPKEMMACDLPVVDVRHPSVESVFGSEDRFVSLADPDPVSIGGRIHDLLANGPRRETIATAAQEFVSEMTWTTAAEQVETALRRWLGERWTGAVAADDDDHERERLPLEGAALIRAHLT
jgi:glycosyltransferase involved in cell wall biosynthesis